MLQVVWPVPASKLVILLEQVPSPTACHYFILMSPTCPLQLYHFDVPTLSRITTPVSHPFPPRPCSTTSTPQPLALCRQHRGRSASGVGARFSIRRGDAGHPSILRQYSLMDSSPDIAPSAINDMESIIRSRGALQPHTHPFSCPPGMGAGAYDPATVNAPGPGIWPWTRRFLNG